MKSNFLIFLRFIVFLVTFFIFSIFIWAIFYEHFNSKIEQKQLKHFAWNLAKIYKQDNNPDILKKFSTITNYRITVINEDGAVIFDSHYDVKKMENHKNRKEIITALYNGEGSSIRFSETLKSKFIYYAYLFTENEGKKVIRVAKEMATFIDIIKPYKYEFLAFLVVLAGIPLVFTIIFLKRVSIVFSHIDFLLNEIGKGNFDVAIPMKKGDIFSHLTNKIVQLAGNIKNLTKDFLEQKNIIHTVLDNMPFPIILFRKDGTIFMKNKIFTDIFHDISHINELNDLIRDEDFYNAMGSFKHNETDFELQVYIKDKVYSLHSYKIKGLEENLLLLTFIDITTIKNIEKMKTEFTANVSHELKTPITVIKGYVETMEDELPESKKFMIETIKKHINRLANLVNDILLLSNLDYSEKIEIKRFSLNQVVHEAINILKQQADIKKLKVIYVENEEIEYNGDDFLILQALINLLSNAIKFTPESGMVKIDTYREKDYVFIEVTDTGIGIPEKYLDKIFNRFFVVEKSRSRELGGTGLGLAIVKHIVNIHGGNIDVRSIINKGSTFRIKLPINITIK